MRRIHSSPSLNHSTNYQFEVSWDERVPDAVKGSHLSPRPLFYRGRCSLNRTSKDASSAVYDHESRQRHSSGRSRRHPRDSSEYVQEDWCPYDCLEIEQNSSSIPDYISTQRVTGSGVLPKDLSISADDPDQFFRCLRCFIIRNTSTQSSRFNEQSSLASVCKHSRKILLVGKKNKKQKFSGVLWLNLQSVVAGRRMDSFEHQLQSTREHDAYIMERRKSLQNILNEIQTFSLRSAQPKNLNVSDDRMKSSIKTVRDMLERYEEFVDLYPNIHAMEKSVHMDDKVRDRITLAYMWYNMVMALHAGVREVGDILGINKVPPQYASVVSPLSASPDASLRPCAKISWPTLESSDDFSGYESGSESHEKNLEVHTSTSSDLPSLLHQPSSVFTAFVSKSLQLKGMRKVLKRLDEVSEIIAGKAVGVLHKPPRSYAEAASAPSFRFRHPEFIESYYNVHNKEFEAMGLPSFADIFLFLVRVPLDLVQEWLRMRGSMQLSNDLLTLHTIMEDCHDCLDAAICVKQNYLNQVQSVGLLDSVILESLTDFENHLGSVFQSYLKCIRVWTRNAARSEGARVEWAERIIQRIQSEWIFAKRFAISVLCGESEAAHIFCSMGCDLFDNMVSNFILERECWLEEKRSESEFIPSLQNAEDDVLSSRSTASPIFVSCRYYKSLVGQLRDRSLRILSFVRLLLSDLEICSSYNLSSQANLESLVSRLQNTSHCLVCFPSFHLDYIVFCDKNSARNVEFVSNLLNFTCSRRESELPDVCVYEIGYLIIFSPDSLPDFCPDTWRGPRIYVNLDADIQMSLRYLRLNSAACLVALNSAALPEMRNRISRSFCDHDKCLLELDEEQFTCHETIYDHIEHLKEKAKAVCEMLWDTFTGGMTEKVLDGEKIESLDSYERESLRATLLQSFDLAFEYYRELFRFIPRKSRAWLAQNTLKWTKQWASFVRSSFSPGDGEVPKWAFQSFGFLLLACDPQLRQYLSANDHTDLLKTARSIILYIKGTSEKGRKKLTDDETDGHSPCRSSTYHRSLLNSDSSASLTSEDRSTRVMEALRKVDVNRNIHMQEERRIGHVIERGRESLSFETYFHPRKRAPFKWQRLEKKIGSGKFGTVYVVMNLDNNCLMAMKQIQIERNHKALHALVEEVENLRSLDHPNLVKYYAVEVHREEIMIFMEYCPEGTLEKICCEGLLDMRCVRKYTHFLLKAVEYIHSMKIVHRDIKPANIFLGKKDVLKLGDFGSSVRLREISTARGEVVEWVGTVPYMAPELHTFGRRDPGEEITGYGRAADIWSVGCVVLEMCTGKPPWSECDHQLQIVYNVGSGMHPTIPPKIRADAQCLSFLEACFIVDRRKRATAEQLRQHPFANIHVAECFEDNRRPVTFT